MCGSRHLPAPGAPDLIADEPKRTAQRKSRGRPDHARRAGIVGEYASQHRDAGDVPPHSPVSHVALAGIAYQPHLNPCFSEPLRVRFPVVSHHVIFAGENKRRRYIAQVGSKQRGCIRIGSVFLVLQVLSAKPLCVEPCQAIALRKRAVGIGVQGSDVGR